MISQSAAGAPSAFGIGLAVAGVVLAVTAAVITNVVLYRRGRRSVSLDRELVEQEAAMAGVMSAITWSGTESGFARTFMGFLETQSITPPEEAYTAYFHSAIARWFQAASALIIALPPKQREAWNTRLAEAHRMASEQGPAAMGPLVRLNDDLKVRVAEQHAELVVHGRELRDERASLERGSGVVWHVGASVQILSLIVIAAANLAGA